MFTAKKITSIITAIIGVVTIILGITLMGESDNHIVDDHSFRYTAESYNADSASFGADFYTYMYKASDLMVSELNDINKAMETVVKAQNSINEAVVTNVRATDDLINTVNHAGGMVVIAIGLGILAYAAQNIGVAFIPMQNVQVMPVATEEPVVTEQENEAEEQNEENA